MSEGSQLKSNLFHSVTWLSLISWWWRSASLIRPKKYGYTSVISLFNSLRQFKDMRIYDFSWRNRFSKREIETLQHWVSCLNYFGLLELWWQYKQIQTPTFGGAVVKTLLSQESFATSVKLNSKCSHMYLKKRLCLQGNISNAFPGKWSVQYKLMLN